MIDLEADEWTAFAEGIAQIAQAREKKADRFRAFRAWLDEHGPFGIVVDAANVAYYGQNFESGGFNFRQIEIAVQYLQDCHSSVKPLVVGSH